MDWRFSTFLLFLFALLIGVPWATSDTGLCGSEYVIGVLRDHTKDGALNCFDFWFNRYQSLIAGILSLISALIAAYLVWRQLAGMYAANEISRRAQAVSQYESVQRRYKALKAAGTFGNQVQRIAQTANHLVDLIRRGNVNEVEINDYRDELIDRCDRALADAEKHKTSLECGPAFARRILPMEFDCDGIKRTVREYEGREGGLTVTGSKDRFCWMLNANARIMMDNSIEYFQWSIAEVRRLESLMMSLDGIIIEEK